MIRRVLFLGLTAVLVAVLVSLALQSRKTEAPKRGPAPESVRIARATATRAVAPADLEVAEPRIELTAAAPRPDSGGGSEAGRPVGLDARHRLTIRNRGAVGYRNVTLEFVYLDRAGTAVGTRVHTEPSPVSAGGTLEVTALERAVPESSARARVAVAFADIEPGSAGKEKQR